MNLFKKDDTQVQVSFSEKKIQSHSYYFQETSAAYHLF